MAAADQPVAIVSGAAGGIGAAIVEALRRDGFRAVGFDLAEPRPGEEDYVRGDLRDPDDCARAVEVACAGSGRLDALVNSAAVNFWETFVDVDVQAGRDLFDVNVWGTINLLKAAQPMLFASTRAAVVNLSSINGQLGVEAGTMYGMSKASLTALTRTLAMEWAKVPVRVNAVAPAIVPTGMNEAARQQPGFVEAKIANIPIGRMIEPSEVADTVAFLAGPRSSGITGQLVFVDGGASTVG